MPTSKTLSTAGLALVFTLTQATLAWPQAAAPPAFPPGPGYAGVAGSPEENARITGLCGANRNAADGYVPTPLRPGQTHAAKAPARQAFDVTVLAKLDRPWGLAILPDGAMLVSIRAGGLRIIDKAGVVSAPLANVPAIRGARLSAMYDVSLDRDFARNRTIYFGYVTRADVGTSAVGRIAKARLSADNTALEDLKILREGPDILPRRIVQARDGTLMIPSAIIDSGGPNPQSLQSQLGKILRINTDGSIPKNNPFLKTKDANPALYALGFRDIHGAAFEPKTGEFWVTENTPMGGDELNRIKPGGNYGFPIISYGRENGGGLINGGKTVQAGMGQIEHGAFGRSHGVVVYLASLS